VTKGRLGSGKGCHRTGFVYPVSLCCIDDKFNRLFRSGEGSFVGIAD
jgi:hypothetical protein